MGCKGMPVCQASWDLLPTYIENKESDAGPEDDEGVERAPAVGEEAELVCKEVEEQLCRADGDEGVVGAGSKLLVSAEEVVGAWSRRLAAQTLESFRYFLLQPAGGSSKTNCTSLQW